MDANKTKNIRKKIRVLHAYKVYLPELHGGIPTAIKNIVSGLRHLCSATIFVTRSRWKDPRKILFEKSLVYRSYSFMNILSLPFSPIYIFRLAIEIRKNDIIVLHAPFPLADIVTSFFVPKNKKLIIHWHADIVNKKIALFFVKYFMNRSLRRADRIIVSAEPVIQNSTILHPYRDKISLIPYGVDLEFWGNLSADEKLKVSCLKTKYSKFVLSVARLVPYKGLDVLISSMKNVNANCIIIGDGPLEEFLNSKIIENKLENRVFILKNVTDVNIKCFMGAASVFVLPSVSSAESFGIAQIEAMAAGLPVINTKLPSSVPWVARDGIEAITVYPGQVEALSAAITNILADDKLRTRLANGAIKRARELFCRKMFIEKYQEIIYL